MSNLVLITQKKLTKEKAEIYFTQDSISYSYKVKRRKTDDIWGLDIELSEVENGNNKSIFKGYLRRGSIWN